MTLKSNFLLDTHLIYWWMTDDRKLDKAIRKLIANADVAVSVASIWEMRIKNAKGKLPLPEGSVAKNLEAHGFRVLPVTAGHVEETVHILPGHSDPFDCLLMATAMADRLKFLTVDLPLLDFARARGLAFVSSGA